MKLSRTLSAAEDIGALLKAVLTSPRKAVEVYRSFIWEGAIPAIDYRQLIDPIDPQQVTLWLADDKYGDMTWQELVVVSLLIRRFRPRRIFEIGTFMGKTTYHLIANAPEGAAAFTLDLPEEGFTEIVASEPYDHDLLCEGKRQQVGHYYKQSPFASQVTQLFADSKRFDPEHLTHTMDLVFIDADHTYQSARSDTKLALQLLKQKERGKILLWHDLRRATGVERAMLDFFPKEAIHRIEGTALGIHVTDDAS